ncbi:MAG: hypothetical protein GKR97_07805 [Rhizobiaceae bacterium]|nr:hypothetical protein [Rhizobiaceae bacterium]
MAQEFPQSEQNDEIDLAQLVLNVWDGKWLIGGITVIFVCLGVLATYFVPTKFSARLEIHQISKAKSAIYDELNIFDFFDLSEEFLLNELMNKLTNKIIIKNKFETSEYLERSNFNNNSQYDFELSKLVNDVKLIAPLSDEEYAKDRKTLRRNNYWEISFEGTSQEKFLLVLKESLEQATAEIRQELIDQFNAKINLRKLQTKNSIMDLDEKISNAFIDYDTATSRRLAFLREQAAIARKLGVSKPSEFVAALDSNATGPFYMRGYDAIEQEIEHLTSRTDKTLFVAGLVELEQQRRALKQSRVLERVQVAFEKSPVSEAEKFVAAEYDIGSTKFEFANTRLMLLGLSGILGIFAGLFILMISNMLRSRKSLSS